MTEDQLLNALWHFFEQVQDTRSMSTAKICADLVYEYEFDVEVLPDNLCANVKHILNEMKRDDFFWDFNMNLSQRCANDYND